MPGPKPPAVPLSEAERQELLALIRAHKTPQHFSFRAQIILHLADGHNAHEVARLLFMQRLTLLLFLPSEHSQLRREPSVSSSGNS
jgi:hypothetical protein